MFRAVESWPCLPNLLQVASNQLKSFALKNNMNPVYLCLPVRAADYCFPRLTTRTRTHIQTVLYISINTNVPLSRRRLSGFYRVKFCCFSYVKCQFYLVIIQREWFGTVGSVGLLHSVARARFPSLGKTCFIRLLSLRGDGKPTSGISA